MKRVKSHLTSIKVWASLLALLAGMAGSALAAEPSGSYDRSTYYSQPMGYSIWKRPPVSVEEFVRLVETGKLNASAQQFAQSLNDAGWIGQPDVPAALAYLRSLKEGTVQETKTYHMGRILRSYRSREGKVDGGYYVAIKVGEKGYFDAQGQLVIRLLCLNVIYPERRVSVLPAQEERVEVPPAAPPPAEEPPASQPRFDQPRQFEPPGREARDPLSPSVPR